MTDLPTTAATWSNLGPPAGFGGEYSTITGLKHGQILIQASQDEANLIAAAPEMFAVVQGFRQKLVTYTTVYPVDKQLRKLLEHCDKAIAKAKGGAA